MATESNNIFKLFAVLVFATLAVILLLVQTPTKIENKAQVSSSPPQKVRITNIYPKGFTITWLTQEESSGAVVYGEKKEELEKDERGALLFFTHSVTIDNLQPRKKYFFKIISGEKTFFKSISDSWQVSGVTEEITLPPEDNYSPRSRPNPIYGQVLNPDDSPAQNTLVFLEIPNKSTTISAVTDNQGKWELDLSNLLKKDWSGPLGYQPELDLIKISAISSPNNSTTSYQTIPGDKTNPVKLTLPTFPGSQITPASTPSLYPATFSPAPTANPTPTKNLNVNKTT